MENKSVKGNEKAETLVQGMLMQEETESDEVPPRTEMPGVQTGLQALKSFVVISFAINTPLPGQYGLSVNRRTTDCTVNMGSTTQLFLEVVLRAGFLPS